MGSLKYSSANRVLSVAALLAIATPAAQAGVGGSVAFETTGFLREASERPEFMMGLTLAPYGEFKSKTVEGRVSILTQMFINELASFSPEGPEGYIATSSELMGGRHQFTFGRRIYEWTAMERGMGYLLSGWSPRFGFDPYNPVPVGLTGLFYTYKREQLQLIAHATPIGIPERMAPTGSPWATPNPTSVPFNGKDVPLRYDMSQIDYAAILLRPGAAVSLRYGEELGPWVRGNYGIMPSHLVSAGVNAKLSALENEIQASIYARGLHDQLLTFEAGYEEKMWGVWAAAHHVAPIFVPAAPASYMMSPVGNGTMVGIGGELRLKEGLTLQSGFASTWEARPAPESQDIAFDMGGRYGYRQLMHMRAKFQSPNSRFMYGGAWLFDIGQLSQRFSVDAAIALGPRKADNPNGPFHIGIGADFIATETGAGTIGQWEGNDLLRARVGYYF
jgi:hypothetical protein